MIMVGEISSNNHGSINKLLNKGLVRMFVDNDNGDIMIVDVDGHIFLTDLLSLISK